jgi:hypothetical protein
MGLPHQAGPGQPDHGSASTLDSANFQHRFILLQYTSRTVLRNYHSMMGWSAALNAVQIYKQHSTT